MRIPRRAAVGVMAVVAAAATSVGMTSMSSASPTPALVTSGLEQHPGKILAGNCFQCHGTNGKNGPWDSLAGKSAAEIVKEMKEMRAKTGSGDEAIMAAHARSYSDAQIALIADYFSKVR